MSEDGRLTYEEAELGGVYKSFNQNSGKDYKYKIVKKRTSTCDVLRYKGSRDCGIMKYMHYEHFKSKE